MTKPSPQSWRLIPKGRLATSWRLSHWAATLLVAIFVGTTGIILYVETSISNLKEVLPIEVIRQERDVFLMIDDLITLQREVELSLPAPTSEGVARILQRLAVVERHLEQMKRVYAFDTLVGASAMQATVRPMVQDLNGWLREGIGDDPPDSIEVLGLVAGRVQGTRSEIKKQFVASNGKALEILQRKATNLERFRGSLVLVALIVAALSVIVVAYVFRQRQAELATASAQQRLRDAVDSIPGGFALFNAKNRLVYCNARFVNLYPAAQGLLDPGRRFGDIVRAASKSGQIVGTEKDRRNWVRQHLQAVRETEEPVDLRHESGETFRITSHLTSDRGFVMISTSITELQQRQAELRESGEKLRQKNLLLDAAIDNMTQGLAMFDESRQLVICNRRFVDLYNLPEGIVQPGVALHHINKFVARAQGRGTQEAAKLLRRRQELALSKQEEGDEEFIMDNRVVNVQSRPLPGGGLLLTCTDVTDNVSAENALRNAKEEAELASRAKSDFLTNVSHELRTPLNAIIGFSEILKDQMFGSLGSDRYQEYAVDIHESGTHLLSLINDILDLSKIEAGKLELQDEAIDLAEIVSAVSRLMRDRADEGGIDLVVKVPLDLPRLTADLRSIKQILLNLLSNAVKFTNPGGRVTVSARVAFDGGLWLDVEDTGIGMERADIEKAMAPFGQVDSALNRKYEGTGLGLPLTRRLVDLNGGNFTLVSRPNEGTRVAIHFSKNRTLAAVRPKTPDIEASAAG